MSSSIPFLYIGCCVVALLVGNARSADLSTKPGPKESVRGYLVDTVCVKEEAAQLSSLGAKHTKKCLQMPACRESGYALLLSSPKNYVLRFDKRGNQLAARLVNGRHMEGSWLLQVTGQRNGEEFAVTTLEIVSKLPVKPGKQ
ncbi:MAG TPA: hypothetical protein VIJ01_11380 [Candidatus Angelobacter sp.]